MIFEYQPNVGFNYMKEFAERFRLSYSDNLLEFDNDMGKGFIKTVDIEEDFRVVVNRIDLNKSLTIRKNASNYSNDFVVFRFKYIIASDKNYLSNVQVVNNGVPTEDLIEDNTSICYLAISIKTHKLLNLLELDKEVNELASFISNFDKPFLYQEVITHKMKNVIRELLEHKNNDRLEKFYFKTKVSELIYEFFSRLFRRTNFNFISINKKDIEKILRIEKIILKDLSIPPVLPELARTIGMSETKMKALFKKIFEESIYNYYSSARMIEAASILKNNRDIAVSEVGYSLGFSSLSHFSKMFKRYMGMNPKQYTMALK